MKKFLYILLIIAILGAGVGGAFYFMKNRPKPKKRPVVEHITLVKTSSISHNDVNVSINLMGTVKPSKSVELSSRVGGEVIYTSNNFRPGQLFKKGETLLKIDPVDYELIVTQRASDVSRAQYELKLEHAQGVIAAQELEFLGEDIKSEQEELLLRKPNLHASKANLDAAKAALKKAELDLLRTTVKAPFNASLQKIHVNLGSQIKEGQTLLTLVESNIFWVEAHIKIEDLKFVLFPSTATVTSNSNIRFKATAIGLLHELEANTSMAKVILEVHDPLGLKNRALHKTPLFIGEHVTASLQGERIKETFKLPRLSVHEGNVVWIMDAKSRLRLETIEPLWQDRDFIYTQHLDITADERLITSPLSTVVEGMKVRETTHE
ncbi:MAG: efflux RND transporter periplasmic adaptor subunit [Campylobacterota bacterium]|nr:efflux RND transporter periplasmic adaptor subunit [Campylobacterota bacterium]